MRGRHDANAGGGYGDWVGSLIYYYLVNSPPTAPYVTFSPLPISIHCTTSHIYNRPWYWICLCPHTSSSLIQHLYHHDACIMRAGQSSFSLLLTPIFYCYPLIAQPHITPSFHSQLTKAQNLHIIIDLYLSFPPTTGNYGSLLTFSLIITFVPIHSSIIFMLFLLFAFSITFAMNNQRKQQTRLTAPVLAL